MIDYSDHSIVMDELQKSQDVDIDEREAVSNAKLFLAKRDGMWEPYWENLLDEQPRYTFDLTSPIVARIVHAMKKADFGMKVSPLGGEATQEMAETYNGILRNIQSISNADHIFNATSKSVVIGGMDGWEVVQAYIDDDAFDQDLLVKNIENFVDRVWFESTAEKQDRSDANFAWKFTAFSQDQYDERWPDGASEGLESNRENVAYFNSPDVIMVGQFHYLKEEERELVLMSNNAVYTDDEDFKKISDELAQMGITEVRRRKRKEKVQYIRLMDANGWLEKEERTVFSYISIIPMYSNYEVMENKTTYFGVVEKRLDPQRVLNFTLTREATEAALSPRAKYWMTKTQMTGVTKTLATLNTNNDPVQEFKFDPNLPGIPQQTGGANVNPALRNISQTMGQMIPQSAGMFNDTITQGDAGRSGVAIEHLRDEGDIGTSEYFTAREIAVAHTGRILLKAIPKVIVGERQVRILGDDGKDEMVTINQSIPDQQTGQMVTLNDLSVGTYDLTCIAGKSFKSRQSETVAGITEIAPFIPNFMEMVSDILLANMDGPGFDAMAKRDRTMKFNAGLIPESEWTDEERQQVEQQQQAQANQPPQEDPMMVAARAEQQKAQAEQQKAQADMLAQQNRQQELQIKDRDMQTKNQLAAAKIEFDQQGQQLKEVQSVADIRETEARTIKLEAETLNKIVESIGADGVMTPELMEALRIQSKKVVEAQLS